MNKAMKTTIRLLAAGLLSSTLAGCAGLQVQGVNSTPAASPASGSLTDTFKNAERAYHKGAWLEAHQEYKAVLARAPDHAPSLFRLGNIAQRLNSLEEARKYYEAAVELTPRDAKARYNLAVVHLALARRQYAAARSLEPDALPQGDELHAQLGSTAEAETLPESGLPTKQATTTEPTPELPATPARSATAVTPVFYSAKAGEPAADPAPASTPLAVPEPATDAAPAPATPAAAENAAVPGPA